MLRATAFLTAFASKFPKISYLYKRVLVFLTVRRCVEWNKRAWLDESLGSHARQPIHRVLSVGTQILISKKEDAGVIAGAQHSPSPSG